MDAAGCAAGQLACAVPHVADAVAAAGVPAVVVDCEQTKGFRLGLARELAGHLRAEYVASLAALTGTPTIARSA